MVNQFENKIKNLVFLLPLVFPLYLWKFSFFNIPINFLEGAVLLLFALHLIFWLRDLVVLIKRKIWSTSYFLRQNLGFLILTLLFFLVALISTAIVGGNITLIDGETLFQSQRVALGILKGWLIIPFIYFLMVYFDTSSKKQLFNLLYAYLFSALPLVVWAFFQYFTGDFMTPDGRASGPFINANYLAMYLAPAVTALWVMIVRGILLGFKLDRFYIGMFLTCIYSVALLMTQSYGAILAVIVSLLMFILAANNVNAKFKQVRNLIRLKKINYLLFLFGWLVVISAAVLFVGTEKFEKFTEWTERSSSSVRLQVYEISWRFISENPLTGLGLGQFEARYNLEAPEILGHAPYEWVMLHPHNTYFATWLNLGLMGLLLFFVLIFYCLYTYFQENEFEDKFFRLIGLSMLIVILIHGLFDTYLFKNDLAMQFWLIIALSILPHKKKILQSSAEVIN